MNEISYLHQSNSWTMNETRHVGVCDLYVTGDISKWSIYDILLSTDENDHILEFNTLLKIIEVMPHQVQWNGKFALGVELHKETWQNEIKRKLLNTNGKICFLNFEKHNLTRDEHEIYLDNERRKKYILDELLKNAKLTIVAKESEKVLYTSTDPTKKLLIGCPPTKCDILMTRSQFVDAIPEDCLQKYVKQNGIIIHFGRLNSKSRSTLPTYIDSGVLSPLDTHNNWFQRIDDYVSTLPLA